ncbi:MAG TPA: heme-binding protein, partial [Usitatibacteraceae bacterium]|nr:heme-binding protein [Usitatibacteraceae bacterium]
GFQRRRQAKRPVGFLDQDQGDAGCQGANRVENLDGWAVVIAVADAGGHPILVARLDGTQSSSVDTAIGKARAAVAFKRPTRLLEEMVNAGRTAFLSVPGSHCVMQGGLPVVIEGQVAGAVGVSGVKASDDEIVAQAGVDAILAAIA